MKELRQFFRFHSKAQAETVHLCLSTAIAWQLWEDTIKSDYTRVFSGEVYTPSQLLAPTIFDDGHLFWIFKALEIFLLVLFSLRVVLPFSACTLSILLLADFLIEPSNHRLLICIFCALSTFSPLIPFFLSNKKDYIDDHNSYWYLDLFRFQIIVIYFFSVVHKLNLEFLSGQTLHSIFVMLQIDSMVSYPHWLSGILQDLSVCRILAIITIVCELALATGLMFKTTTRISILLGFVMHGFFAILIPYVWCFTLSMWSALIGSWCSRKFTD